MARLLKEISHMEGIGMKMMFASDSESKEGKVIIHFIRFETIVLDADETFYKTKFNILNTDTDKRLDFLADCIRKK